MITLNDVTNYCKRFVQRAGDTVTGLLSVAMLKVTSTLSGTPAANTLYKAGSGVGFDVPLDASVAAPTIRPILDAAQGGISAGSEEGWHEIGAAGEPAFQTGWSNYGGGYSTAAFRKDATGTVFLKGRITGGTSTGVIFRLPAGYRPATGNTLWIYVPATTGAGALAGSLVTITSGGDVQEAVHQGGTLGLDNICFKADN